MKRLCSSNKSTITKESTRIEANVLNVILPNQLKTRNKRIHENIQNIYSQARDHQVIEVLIIK